MTKIKKPYCLAPWVHAHVNVAGRRAPCCEANSFDQEEFLTLDVFWNSNVMKSLRLKMLNQEPPSELCAKCINSTNSTALKDIFNEDYGYLTDEIDKLTAKDGHFDKHPSYYDYRISNICNLSCRMCNAESSSKIEQAILNVEHTTLEDIRKLEVKKELNQFLTSEIIDGISKGIVRKIYWASGEAFFQKDHWKIIDFCINNNFSSSIELIYNTNLSYSITQSKQYFKKLSNFRRVALLISIDASENTAKFIRDGLSWNNFVTNLNLISEYPNVKKSSINITLTIPTLLDIKHFSNFLEKQNIPIRVGVCNLGGTSSLYSPLSLDKETLDKLVANALEVLSSKKNKSLFDPLIQVLNNLKAYPSNFENQETKRELLDLFFKGLEIDDYFGRKNTVKYYLRNTHTNSWIKKVILQKTPSFSNSNFWYKYLELISYTDQNTLNIHHNYQIISNRKEFFYSIIQNNRNLKRIEIITSAPTALNLHLTRNSKHGKFLAFKEIIQDRILFDEELKNLKIKEQKYLGLFKFLFENKPLLKPLAGVLDFFVKPLNRFLCFHYLIVLEIER